MAKERLDVLIVNRGLAESRTLAQKLIMAGEVRVDGNMIIKPSQQFTEEVEITIDKGRGYVSADENKPLHEGINVICIDSIHTPIKQVRYEVQNFRVEQKTDFEKLIIEIYTDGSIHPKEALKEAAKILIQHFILFSDEKILVDTPANASVEGEFDDETLRIRTLLKTKLVDMDLSVRALNCLQSAQLETLGDVVSIHKSDLLKFRNFGKKSLSELEDLVKSKGLEFGMKVDKYKLDKD